MYACVREVVHTLIQGFIQDFCQRGEIVASGNVGGSGDMLPRNV